MILADQIKFSNRTTGSNDKNTVSKLENPLITFLVCKKCNTIFNICVQNKQINNNIIE